MNRRPGYSLVELVVSMTAATVLLTGLASALFITIEMFEEQPVAFGVSRAESVQEEIARDLGRATGFTALSADTATFTVPDEDGDGAQETLTYQYDGAADELRVTRQGSTTTLLTGVTASSFGALPRTLTGSAPTPTPYDVNDWGDRWVTGVVYEGFTEVKGDTAATSTALSLPVGVSEGDLLIAAIVFGGGPTPVVADASWNELSVNNNNGRVLLAVWWKIAAASEPSSHTFSWAYNENFYGWMMRFTGNNLLSPINNSAIGANSSSTPATPSVTTTVDNCLVLRLGGFDDDDITEDAPGVANHLPITMDRNMVGQNFTCSGGAAYSYQQTAGDTGAANFTLTASEEYATITIALAPE